MAAGKHLQRYDYDTAKDRKATTAAAAANMANGIIVATATHTIVSLSPVCTANAGTVRYSRTLCMQRREGAYTGCRRNGDQSLTGGTCLRPSYP